jgi:RNA-splicing ligase RtcB
MPEKLGTKLLSWATDLDDNTVEQARRTATLPFIEGHVALMPDAHLGYGATVGSVIPTRGAIIPSAVGVDIGCGMIAVETDLGASDLPDDLGLLLKEIERRIPAGVGQGHEHEQAGTSWLASKDYTPQLVSGSQRETARACSQFGTLGSGNHFVEVCLDERDTVWVVLHSGSRGVGNKLAQHHIETAKGLMARYFIELEDPGLAYFVEGTQEFAAYIDDLLWAQDYALANREQMMNRVLDAVLAAVGKGAEVERINCHHNYAEMEHHWGKNLWVTRKGAIRAREGDRGVIPGSMGAASYIVSGLGHAGSFTSASHGAGRKMSRTQARKTLTADNLTERMAGRAWLSAKADALLDEHPDAYKDIDAVMENQRDLVRIDHSLRQVLNYKGA